jgi:hypothetical protein
LNCATFAKGAGKREVHRKWEIETLKRRDDLKFHVVHEGIIWKWVLEHYDVMMWND